MLENHLRLSVTTIPHYRKLSQNISEYYPRLSKTISGKFLDYLRQLPQTMLGNYHRLAQATILYLRHQYYTNLSKFLRLSWATIFNLSQAIIFPLSQQISWASILHILGQLSQTILSYYLRLTYHSILTTYFGANISWALIFWTNIMLDPNFFGSQKFLYPTFFFNQTFFCPNLKRKYGSLKLWDLKKSGSNKIFVQLTFQYQIFLTP